MRSFVAVLILVGATGVAAAERPKLLTIDVPPHPRVTEKVAPYNTIFLNRCASGCSVRSGGTNSSASPDTSSIVSGSHVLTKFKFDDATWTKVVSCVRDTFETFNVQITDADPGATPHFEIMVGGDPADLGFPSQVGGVSPNGCGDTYIPNALVFDFANVWSNGAATCSQSCIEDICSTAAQEIGHSFGMDHSHNKADPMTYFPFAGRRYFQNSADPCGSDCTAGQGPMGNACSGTDNQVHTCCVDEGSTQNSYTTLLTLFGPGSPTPPIVSITNPQQGASVKAGFPVAATATDDSSVAKVELRVDGTLVQTLMSMPYAFNAPATLGDGSHTVEVTAYDAHGTPGTKMIDVNIGPPCQSAAECPNTTDACIGGRCVPGPGVDGGLGTTCTANSDCGDQNCASDGTNQYCTTACMKGQCPDNFGCLDTGDGTGNGYCWPGYDDGSGGGCSTHGAGGPGGAITCGLAFAALLIGRRRKA